MPTRTLGPIPSPRLVLPRPRTAVQRAHRRLTALLLATHQPEVKNPRLDVAGIQQRFASHPQRKHLIVATTVGTARPRSAAQGTVAPPGSPCLRIYVQRPMSRPELAAWVHEHYGDPVLKDKELPFEIIVCHGPAHLLGSNHDRIRPARAGLSCSTATGFAGTIGFFARGRGADSDNVYLVSNNHILARGNAGVVDEPIFQPAILDGGTAADVIATLSHWVPVQPGLQNFLDCAAARVGKIGDIDPQMVQHFQDGSRHFFSVGHTPVAPGPLLGKCGRSTDVKSGRLQNSEGAGGHHGTCTIEFGSFTAVFVNQIEIADETAPFCEKGDSGSLVWNFDAVPQPVGLLGARLGTTTFANPIQLVLDALEVDML